MGLAPLYVDVYNFVTGRTCTGSRLTNVRITSAAVGLKIANAEVDLQYIHLERNLDGVHADISQADTPLTISHSVFEHNRNIGLTLETTCDVSIADCRFSDNKKGVAGKFAAADRVSIEVLDSTFVHNNDGGYLMENGWHTTIYNTAFTDSDVRLRGEAEHVSIDLCSFSKPYDTCLDASLENIAVNTTISNTILHDCDYGASLEFAEHSSVRLQNVTVERSSRRGLHIATSQSFVYLSDSTFRDNDNAIVISTQNDDGSSECNASFVNNEFTGNSGENVVDINTDIDFIIENNTFVDNTATVTVAYYSANRGNLRMARNVFENPEAEYDLTWSSACVYCVVDARFNWWGTANITAIPRRILDFFLDMSLDEVLLSPVLSSSSIESAYSVELTSRDFKMDEHTIGGRVKENTIIEVGGNTRQVQYTIHVPAGIKLVLHLNSPLSFAANTGIYVEGMYCVGCIYTPCICVYIYIYLRRCRRRHRVAVVVVVIINYTFTLLPHYEWITFAGAA